MEPERTQSLVIEHAVAAIREAVPGAQPRLGIVLGSGLGGLVDGIEVAGTVDYSDIPGFRTSTVEGHAGRMVIGTLEGTPIVAMQGRVHLYEGYPASEVVFPIRVMVRLGAERLIVTNAAGGVNPDFDEKEIMLISDHLNLTGTNPLHGPNDLALGPRFPDMTDPYDGELRRIAREVADEIGFSLREGVYAGLLGPSYETPAEVRMLGRLGADAVGMSTVLEVIAARHMGAQVLGLSCISNKGAGLAAGPLSHEEVKAAGAAVQADFIRLVSAIVARMG